MTSFRLHVCLYCCADCLSYPANAIRMSQATWAIWAAIKKYSLSWLLFMVPRCEEPMENLTIIVRVSPRLLWWCCRALEDSIGTPLFVIFRHICQMHDDDPNRQALMLLCEEMYTKQRRIGFNFLYFLKVRYVVSVWSALVLSVRYIAVEHKSFPVFSVVLSLLSLSCMSPICYNLCISLCFLWICFSVSWMPSSVTICVFHYAFYEFPLWFVKLCLQFLHNPFRVLEVIVVVRSNHALSAHLLFVEYTITCTEITLLG